MGDEYDSRSEYGEDLPRADTYVIQLLFQILVWLNETFFDDPNNIPGWIMIFAITMQM